MLLLAGNRRMVSERVAANVYYSSTWSVILYYKCLKYTYRACRLRNVLDPCFGQTPALAALLFPPKNF